MDITTSIEDGIARVTLAGSLNTNTATDLELALEPLFADASRIVFDFTDLEYVSSAGLRVLMVAYKQLGDIEVSGASEEVREVFDITGFSDLFSVR